MNIFDDIDYYENLFQNRRNVDVPLRYLRDAQDPYAMDMMKFKVRYRFSQQTVKNIILPLIVADLQKFNRRGLPLAPELQILVCLRFYATASFQIVCGDLLYVSQPSVSNIVANISKLLAMKNCQFIKYPENMTSYRQKFAQFGRHNQYAGLLNVDGAIDCTHIKIVDTPGVQQHEAYRNRKSYFSINVQAIVGPSGEFMDVVARWAGSTHDSRIFQMSLINMKYTQGIHNGKLVGDGGYPCLPYLLTPVNPINRHAEEIYNKVHIKTRNIVERSFGKWKRRFPCLRRGLGNKLSTVSNIIVACAVLHNLALKFNEETPIEDEGITDEADETEGPQHNLQYSSGGSADGFAIRESIINQYAALQPTI